MFTWCAATPLTFIKTFLEEISPLRAFFQKEFKTKINILFGHSASKIVESTLHLDTNINHNLQHNTFVDQYNVIYIRYPIKESYHFLFETVYLLN